MQHLLFIFTDKLMIFFSKFWYKFGIFLITYFGIYLVYNLEHFGIFYSEKPGNPGVEKSVTHAGFGKGRPQGRVWGQNPQPPEAKGVWGQSPMPPSNFRVFTKKNTHFGEVFLLKKDPPVPEILTTCIGIRNNARAKGGTMAPWPPLRAPIWSIHYF